MQSAADVISSLFWFSDDKNEIDGAEPEIVEQFVNIVEDFSSQYGSEVSVSYTAFNLRGPPSNFPDYGDYPQSFVMRTYGMWWEQAPSAQEEYMPQNTRFVPSQDFVEISFAQPVFPLSVSLFETYNPGALVRIWARAPTAWVLLWEGAPQRVGDTPRIFSPPIRLVNFSTRILRLEFNHWLLPYYTELDAVLLKGRREPTATAQTPTNFSYSSLFQTRVPHTAPTGAILSRILASNLHECVAAPLAVEQADQGPGPPLGDFQCLPDETILCIMQYLDLQSLCRCSQANRQFRRLASDSILYRSLDLRPYWHCVHSQVLAMLATRCKLLQRLDLSWCGSHGSLTALYVASFLQQCGELTHLRLNSCKFVDSNILRTVGSSHNLRELCLRSVRNCDWSGLQGLTQLRRIDLYRTDVSTGTVVMLARANPRLQHLNLGSCGQVTVMDEVLVALGAHCRDLRSLDLWKSHSLTVRGLFALATCRQLRELDVGWCVQLGGSGEWLRALEGCRELRKLFLGALRGVADRELRALLPAVPHLQQLDLLGVRAITPPVCAAILMECRELKLLDLSFCDQIPEVQVDYWRSQYPSVSIKRSFQAGDMPRTAPTLLSPPLLMPYH